MFLGRDFSTRQSFSEAIASQIDDEIHAILESSYAETVQILKDHDDALENVAQALLLVETLDGKQFEALYNGEITPEELKTQIDEETKEKEKRDKAEAAESKRLEAERKAAEQARMEELKRSVIGESADNLSPADNEILNAILKAGTVEVPKRSDSKSIEIGLDSDVEEKTDVKSKTDEEADTEPKTDAESETADWEEVSFSPAGKKKEENTSVEEPVSKDEE